MSAFSPQVLESMKEQERFMVQASKAVDPFKPFPGPDGEYFAELNRIVGAFDTKKGCLKVTAAFTLIAFCENNSQDYAGYSVRIQCYVQATAKQSLQEAWDRLYTSIYQALGCVTASWSTLFDSEGKPVPIYQTLESETERLNKEHPCVMLSIKEQTNDKRYKNINIREVLDPSAISHLARVAVVLTDDDIASDTIEEAPTAVHTEELTQAKQLIADMDREKLLETITTNELPVDASAASTAALHTVRQAVLKAYADKAEWNIGDFDTTFSPEELEVREGLLKEAAEDNTVVTSSTTVVPILPEGIKYEVIAEVFEELEEELKEEEAPFEADEPAVRDEFLAAVAAMPRIDIQKKIRSIDPASKFFKTQTDADLQGWLASLTSSYSDEQLQALM